MFLEAKRKLETRLLDTKIILPLAAVNQKKKKKLEEAYNWTFWPSVKDVGSGGLNYGIIQLTCRSSFSQVLFYSCCLPTGSHTGWMSSHCCPEAEHWESRGRVGKNEIILLFRPGCICSTLGNWVITTKTIALGVKSEHPKVLAWYPRRVTDLGLWLPWTSDTKKKNKLHTHRFL